MIRPGLICALVMVAGCSGGVDGEDANGGDDGSGSGSGGAFPSPCSVTLNIAPLAPAAGPSARVTVTAAYNDIPGLFTPVWTVTRGAATVTTTDGGDGRSVSFATPDPGIYDVGLALDGAPAECASASRAVNVVNAQGAFETLRLRVLAPQRYSAPPLEVYVQLQGGSPAQDTGAVVVATGQATQLHVLDANSNGVPAYLQLSPAGTPDAIIEAFTDAGGAASVVTAGGLYNVLVVPSDGVSVPRRIANWSAGVIGVTAGQAVTGKVLGPDSAALAGARVQLTVDGTASTVATTAADGSFAVHVEPRAPGAQVVVDVAPLAETGLPRLSATSTSFSLGAAFQISYAKNVVTRDLAGVVVRRAGAGVAGAQVTVVGQVGGVGSVTAGGTASATGSVALTATTDAGGALPAMKVPAATLSAVIAARPSLDPGDVAVAALDTTTSAPASLDAPGMALIATAITDSAKAALGGAVLDLIPTGALAAAGGPPVHAVADASGAITARIAAGGHYDLRLHDPAGRGGPVAVTDRTTATIPTSLALGAPLAVRGQVLYAGHTALSGAAVELLCNDCAGALDRTRPIAEGQTDAAGRFVLTVPDPGLR